jgi:hypothetical protein
MIQPQAIALLRCALNAFAGVSDEHRLLTALIDEGDTADVVETLVIVAVALIDRVRETDPDFDPGVWLQRLGLLAAAGAR